jgi:hypothetical protein
MEVGIFPVGTGVSADPVVPEASVHDQDRPRIDPLPEEEWDDEIRSLVELNWSGPPPGNRNNLYRTMVRHPDLYRTWHEFGRVAFHGRINARDRQVR